MILPNFRVYVGWRIEQASGYLNNERFGKQKKIKSRKEKMNER